MHLPNRSIGELQIIWGLRIILIFFFLLFRTYVVTHHLNRLIETVLMRGHKICFCVTAP